MAFRITKGRQKPAYIDTLAVRCLARYILVLLLTSFLCAVVMYFRVSDNWLLRLEVQKLDMTIVEAICDME